MADFIKKLVERRRPLHPLWPSHREKEAELVIDAAAKIIETVES